jgi:hypothetical protein
MAEVQGQSQKVHRVGSKESGAWGHIRGWNTGVIVEIRFVDGRDVVTIWRTGGSNSPYSRKFVAEFSDEKVPA